MTTSPPFVPLDDPQHPAPRDGTLVRGKLYFGGVPGTFRVRFYNGHWRHGDSMTVCNPVEWAPIAPVEGKGPTDGEMLDALEAGRYKIAYWGRVGFAVWNQNTPPGSEFVAPTLRAAITAAIQSQPK